MNRALKIGRKWLYVTHRWVGIVSCLLFAVWFVSGVVMMYAPYPSLTEQERLAGLAPIDWPQVKLGPTEAMAAGGLKAFPSRLKLEMTQGQPVYRIVDGRRRIAVSARDGHRIGNVSPEAAADIARRFSGGARVEAVDTLERDQWTVAGGFDPQRPLHRVRLADPAGTILYVSSTGAEVVQNSTRAERFWNWVGSVPHWIYLTGIRQDQPFWRQVVMWTSGVGIVGAISGVWIGLLRLRLKRRYAQGKVSPYRGWMKWHHIGGLVTGLALTTWIISGWLSVNPFGWFSRSSTEPAALVRYAGVGAPRFDADLARLGSAAQGARTVRFLWTAGRPLAEVSRVQGEPSVLDARTGSPADLAEAALIENARFLMPRARVAATSRLTEEDVYWYGHQGVVPLPVLRVRFDDPAHTWVHIDPRSGEVLGLLDDNGRAERWLFNFLHDFDLPVLMRHRPAWDLLVWGLSVGGMIIAVSSVVIGWRRLKYDIAHLRRRRRRRAPRPAEASRRAA